MTSATLFLLATALQAGPVAPSSPSQQAPGSLSPSGKWTLEVANNACLLSREYGSNPQAVTLALRKYPTSPSYELILFRAGNGKGPAVGAPRKNGATIRIEPGGRAITTDFDTRVPNANSKLRVTTMSIAATDMADIATSTGLSISTEAGPPVSLMIKGGQKAAAALKSCNDDLLRVWKIDPSETDHVAKHPSTQPATWLSDDDYPAAAKGTQGVVFAVFKVNTNGRVTDCRAVTSSGSAILDATTCRLIEERARYKPALDESGKPLAIHKSITFTWRNPTTD